MPLYDYQCVDCTERDLRIGGLDDAMAICHICGGVMLRLDDPFYLKPEHICKAILAVVEGEKEEPKC